MPTPITYLKIQSDSAVLDIPIYNPIDVVDSSFRIFTSEGLGCFDLVSPTVNTSLRIMTENGIRGIQQEVISGPIIITEDFLDDTYVFTFGQGFYPFNRFNGASLDGNLGYIKSSLPTGVHSDQSNIAFDLIVPTGKANSRVEIDYAVDSEVGFDFLYLKLDEVTKHQFSGLNIVGTASIPVPEGEHVLRLLYGKDSNGIAGTDAAYISEIRLYLE